MTTSLQPLAVKTHSEFFFNDGNAVLRVKGSATANASVDATKALCSTPDGSSTSDTTYTYFRVHKSILSDLSDVFSTMFSIPQSESQSSDPFTYEGCDMVELHDDISDVTKLMKVVYGRAPVYKRLSQTSFDFYAPVLRLAQKYDIQWIMDTYLPCVTEGWPTSLEDWDALEQEVQGIAERSRRKRSQGASLPLVDDIFVEPASIIGLARHFPSGLRSILPAVYYHLSRIPPHMHRDTSAYVNYADAGGCTANRSLLLASEYEALYSGKAAMAKFFFESILNPFTKISAAATGCGTGLKKSKATLHATPVTVTCSGTAYWREVMSQRILNKLGNNAGFLDILKRMIADIRSNGKSGASTEADMCSECKGHLIGGLERLRYEFWQELPKFFKV